MSTRKSTRHQIRTFKKYEKYEKNEKKSIDIVVTLSRLYVLWHVRRFKTTAKHLGTRQKFMSDVCAPGSRAASILPGGPACRCTRIWENDQPGRPIWVRARGVLPPQTIVTTCAGRRLPRVGLRRPPPSRFRVSGPGARRMTAARGPARAGKVRRVGRDCRTTCC